MGPGQTSRDLQKQAVSLTCKKSHHNNQKFYFWRPSWNLAKPRVISGKQAVSLSLRTNGHFPVEPGSGGFIEAKNDGSDGDNCSYKTCKAPIKSSPTNQHPVFTGRMSFLSPNQQCQSTEGNLAVKQTKFNISGPDQMSVLTLSEECPDCQSI